MIYGIGADIVRISRFENVTARFMERCYTAGEREYLKSKRANSKAGLFAAKEAAVKSLGAGFKGFWPSDVEIIHGGDSQPVIILHGKAKLMAEEAGVGKIWVSISHSETDAVAFAIAERTGKNNVIRRYRVADAGDRTDRDKGV